MGLAGRPLPEKYQHAATATNRITLVSHGDDQPCMCAGKAVDVMANAPALRRTLLLTRPFVAHTHVNFTARHSHRRHVFQGSEKVAA